MEMNWISVRDRLPDNEEEVLAYPVYGEVEEVLYRNGFTQFEGSGLLDGVTHWMPKPEPPREIETLKGQAFGL